MNLPWIRLLIDSCHAQYRRLVCGLLLTAYMSKRLQHLSGANVEGAVALTATHTVNEYSEG